MNIRLNDHSEEILKQQLAQGHFRTPEEVVERALQLLASQDQSAPQAKSEASRPDFTAFLDNLAVFSHKIPPMSGITFSRDWMYEEHP